MTKNKNSNGATLGFEQKLWSAADKLRSNMDAAEYKHVVLGLIFLKYISDTFQDLYEDLCADREQGADPEDPENIVQRTFSGFQKRHDSHIFKKMQSNR